VTRRLVSWLVAACLLLALALAALWFAPGAPARWRVWNAPPPQPPNLDDAQAARLAANPAAAADYPETLERPLLIPARRPASDASDAAPAADPPLAIEQVKFTGIIDGPDLTGVLLEEDGKPRFVRQGEAIGDWRLDAIDGRTITFRRRAERKQIDLPYADMTGGAPNNNNKTAAKTPLGAPPPPPPRSGGRPAAAPANAPAAAPQPPAPAASRPAPRAVPRPASVSSQPIPATTSVPGGNRKPSPAKGGTP
jgi:2-oxoglutarate dehydrogenase E2 component (dihydrolipoamide succinyltransferase)